MPDKVHTKYENADSENSQHEKSLILEGDENQN